MVSFVVGYIFGLATIPLLLILLSIICHFILTAVDDSGINDYE
jgi:hypothetical protein